MLFRHLTGTHAEQQANASMHIWVRGPELPPEIEEEGLLTAEDHRDLTLDHIARTCEMVVQLQIVKRG